jgi:hypothetical protein
VSTTEKKPLSSESEPDLAPPPYHRTELDSDYIRDNPKLWYPKVFEEVKKQIEQLQEAEFGEAA